MTEISAYIPCHNNRDTISAAIDSIKTQTHPVSQIFVVDDSSHDGSAEIAKSMSVPVLRPALGAGRGAARAFAMLQAEHELVLCLDASKSLPEDFVEKALHWMSKPNTGAVFGQIVQPEPLTAAGRWCGRHLLRCELVQVENRKASLVSAAAIVRKSAVMKVGNYDRSCTFAEDRELGARLLDAGFEVVFDPSLTVTTLVEDDLWTVLERYWRWHAALDGQVSFSAYIKQIVFSVKVMAAADLSAGDPGSIPISLLSPHYQLLRSLFPLRR